MSKCLTDELLARLLDDQLTVEERSRVHRHIDECAPCHALVAAVVHNGSSRGDPGLSPPASTESFSRTSLPVPGWRPPAAFDEFRLVRPLGKGAMGIVYLAEDTRLGRQVAVKFIAAHQPGIRVLERFQNEARAIAKLQHPNVVTVFRTGEVGGHPFIVSEYIEGQTLSQLSLPLPWRRVLGLGIGLARGLAEAHEQQVLHRDIKPSNVLLTQGGEVKLLDFGLAQFAGTEATPEASGARQIAGTPRYMAPELFRGTSAAPRSDLYALGLVLYELCTGTLPPRSGDPLPSPGASPPPPTRTDVLPPLTELVPGIDPDFAALIERCLHPDPEKRYASSRALCAALEKLQVPEVLSEGNPYRGLAPFEAEHRALFFGRDEDIRQVVERLRRGTLVLVAGDSGVGKSSLCRAGILPRISQGALDEYRDFTCLTLEPGRHPLTALAAALAPILKKTEAELSDWLTGEPGRLGPALRAAYLERRGLLLFVDQLEELITLGEPVQAEHFARLLGELGALNVSVSGVRVLLTVRGDFLTRVGALPGLDGAVERSLYLLQPLSPKGVREAIVGPARSRGVSFESEALLQTLVEAATRGAGSLPLLQFALAELWERRDPIQGRITQEALEAMGGVAGALSRHADALLSRLSAAEQLAARRLLGRLITAEGTRGARSEEELSSSPDARTALRVLAEGRLVHARTVEKRASYEIAHEALIASWTTLRHWLDEDAGQRALRQRLEAAGAEWVRLGNAEDLLWRKRQLDEARTLEGSLLGTRERDFLRASHHAVRRRRLRIGLAVGLVVLGGGLLSGGLLLREYLGTQRFVGERMATAQAALATGNDLSQRVKKSREDALQLFEGRDPEDSREERAPQNFWPRAEATWAQTLKELDRADAAHAEAASALDDILERVAQNAQARELRIELTYKRILLAETFYDRKERDRLLRDFRRQAAHNPEWLKRLETPAVLDIKTTPPDVSVEIKRYVDDESGGRRLKSVPGLGPLGKTPVADVHLPAGSYRLRFQREGSEPVDLPLLLERGQSESIDLKLPSTVPEGYIYIPPGRFLLGSGDPEDVRDFMHSSPLHSVYYDRGYLIGRTEVTLRDWMTYLESGDATEEERRLLETPRLGTTGALTLLRLPDKRWRYSLIQPNGTVLTARSGEPLRYPGRRLRQEQDWRRFPLTGVSVKTLKGFLTWLDRTGKLPGARLCNETEWLRAARGADDRRHPHGNRLQKDDANIDITYDRQPNDFGPDEVGTHPESVSPFGLQDMAGNAFEITQAAVPDLGGFVILGGAWYYERIGTFVSNRQAFTSAASDSTVGVRLCADWPPAVSTTAEIRGRREKKESAE
ncbi:putative serine/threonine protein kinase [Cystobacter fuscus]|uniref:Putative serine/threonine protein kinase n=1 Tax=Cystobacter fuscus TaxID=43 RepID=A0A250JAE2_9BACT|nr:bifunctional serine/threonine-protein kinase/formylglycine-generating enzyme family protein [Cystobacter fuscus]ATB40889.1 putative serine/threonine protein kinase [Cystobacter fuscus]